MGLSSVTHFYVTGPRLPNSVEYRKIRHYAVQGHSVLVSIKPICDFLLVINTNFVLTLTISRLLQIIHHICTFDRGEGTSL